MRTLLLLPIFSSTLAPCHGGYPPPEPDAPPPPIATTLDITADQSLALVVFRDGVNAAWQPATMKTPTRFEATVHGPYIVATVCDESGIFVTRQLAGTPDDSHQLDAICGAPAANRSVTGHMAQPGFVTFGDSGQGFFGTGGWDFQFTVADGSYDLVGTTDDAIELRRGIAVSSDLAITPDVDVAQRGTPLASVAFGANNAAANEQLAASVLLDTAASFGSDIYEGPSATAKVAPESVLVANDDQSVSVQATVNTTAPTELTTVGRSLRQPFRVGDNATYTLPPAIGPIQFSTDSGTLVVTWTDRPATSIAFATSVGLSTDGTDTAANVLQMTASFLNTTAITQATYATDLPGYRPEWKIDFTKQYAREIDLQSVVGPQSSTNWHSDLVNLGTAAPLAARPARAARLTPGVRR